MCKLWRYATFLPSDAMLVQYMLWQCVRLSVHHKPVRLNELSHTIPYDSQGNLVF